MVGEVIRRFAGRIVAPVLESQAFEGVAPVRRARVLARQAAHMLGLWEPAETGPSDQAGTARGGNGASAQPATSVPSCPAGTQRKVIVYTNRNHASNTVKQMLREYEVDFEEVDVSGDAARRQWIVETTGDKVIPKVFVDGRSIGTVDDLADLKTRGELHRILFGRDKANAPA